MTEQQSLGNVCIADDVVSVIAKIAAAEIEGVRGVSAGFSGIRDIVGSKNHTKGIKTQITDNMVNIDIHISIKQGIYIPEAAKKVQANIKQSIESMTGLTVQTVNVYIQNIVFKSEEDKPAETDD